MTRSRRAARSLAGFVLVPTVGQEEAGRALGAPLTETAWKGVEHAIAHYGDRLEALGASKASRKKDDPQSWHFRQAAVTRALEVALDKIAAARQHGDFLFEASENYALQTHGMSAGPNNAYRLLERAHKDLLTALVIIDRALPEDIEVLTPAAARDQAVRDIVKALRGEGLVVETSDGWRLDALELVRIDDLTGFEKLIAALGLGDDKPPRAFAAWLRGVIKEENGGS